MKPEFKWIVAYQPTSNRIGQFAPYGEHLIENGNPQATVQMCAHGLRGVSTMCGVRQWHKYLTAAKHNVEVAFGAN